MISVTTSAGAPVVSTDVFSTGMPAEVQDASCTPLDSVTT